MATRFIDKDRGASSTTAIANDTAGTRKVRDLPDAVGVAFDTVDRQFKYNDNGTIRTFGAISQQATASLTGASTLTAADSGKTFFLNLAGGFATTLPSPSAGWNAKFFVGTAPSGGSYTIVTAGGTDLFHGVAVSAADAGGSVDSTAGTAADTITLVDGQALKGDSVELTSDGTSWYVRGFCSDEDAITFTQT